MGARSSGVAIPVAERGRAIQRTRPRTLSQVDLRHAAWVAVLLLAAAVRFYRLDALSFWFDEGMSVGIARLDWRGFFAVLARREANMALYYALLKGWLAVAHGEAFVRGLSAIFGIAAVAVTYRIGRRIGGEACGAIAALLVSVNAMAVHFSREARGYSLAMLLVALSADALLAAVAEGGRRRWRWYWIWSALAVYAHLYCGLVLLAQWTWLAMLRFGAKNPAGERFASNEEICWPDAFAAVRASCYALLPLAAAVAHIGSEPIFWVPPLSWHEIAKSLTQVAGGDQWMAAALIGIACLTGLLVQREAKREIALLLCWIAVPFAIVVVGSVLRPLLVARYMLICVPAVALLAAAGLARMPRSVAIVFLAALTGLSAAASAHDATTPAAGHDDWRNASRYVLANARRDDSVFFYTTPGRAAFEFYRWADGAPEGAPQAVLPAHPQPWRDLVAQPLAEILPDASMTHPRLWLVLSQNHTDDFSTRAVSAWIARSGYAPATHVFFDGIEVVLYTR